jgi:protein translocase SecG subunit
MGIAFTLLTVLFIAVSVALVLVILVQRPQGGGLASAFGGRTGDALTVATVAVFSVYLLLAIGLNIFNRAPAKEETPAAVSESAPASQEVPMTPIQVPASQPAAAQPESAAPAPAAPAAPAPAPAAPAAAPADAAPAAAPAAPAPAPAIDPAAAPKA